MECYRTAKLGAWQRLSANEQLCLEPGRDEMLTNRYVWSLAERECYRKLACCLKGEPGPE